MAPSVKNISILLHYRIFLVTDGLADEIPENRHASGNKRRNSTRQAGKTKWYRSKLTYNPINGMLEKVLTELPNSKERFTELQAESCSTLTPLILQRNQLRRRLRCLLNSEEFQVKHLKALKMLRRPRRKRNWIGMFCQKIYDQASKFEVKTILETYEANHDRFSRAIADAFLVGTRNPASTKLWNQKPTPAQAAWICSATSG